MNEKIVKLWATKNKNDEWWSSFVTAPLAVLVNFFVVDFKCLSPNLITLVSFIVALAATSLIIVGNQSNFYIAAVLIHASHILDCMDGQMARYRGASSRSGVFFDKVTDLAQVIFWFGAIGYAAYVQTNEVLPVFLAFAGVAFYSLRGYIKYTALYIEMSEDKDYLDRIKQEVSAIEKDREGRAGLEHGFFANFKWFMGEQRKFFSFDEGVFIFMLTVALIFDIFVPVLWVFAISQIFYGILRSFQRGYQLHKNRLPQILTTTEK